MPFQSPPDLDAIARNLLYLDLGHIELEEAAPYELELSAIASLNEAIETIQTALQGSANLSLWQSLYPTVSSASSLLASRLTPLIDLNAERAEAFEPDEPEPVPAALLSCR